MAYIEESFGGDGGYKGRLEQRRDTLLNELEKIEQAIAAINNDPNVVALIETILKKSYY
jgi:hypothetical protein